MRDENEKALRSAQRMVAQRISVSFRFICLVSPRSLAGSVGHMRQCETAAKRAETLNRQSVARSMPAAGGLRPGVRDSGKAV